LPPLHNHELQPSEKTDMPHMQWQINISHTIYHSLHCTYIKWGIFEFHALRIIWKVATKAFNATKTMASQNGLPFKSREFHQVMGHPAEYMNWLIRLIYIILWIRFPVNSCKHLPVYLSALHNISNLLSTRTLIPSISGSRSKSFSNWAMSVSHSDAHERDCFWH